MSESVRLYQYRALLESRRIVSKDELMASVETSHATFKRDLSKMRDQMGMPIMWDKDRQGYYLDRTNSHTELPGLWFSPQELVALLTIQQLIEQLEPGLIGDKLKPLKKKLIELLESKGLDSESATRRVRMNQAGKRQLELKCFEQVALGTITRRRIKVNHLNRERGDSVLREISPQELVHYRDNWYVDAWCHLRGGIRSFSIDAIADVEILETPAQDIDAHEMRRATQSSYGIFGGAPTDWAVLRFSSVRARWVESEVWHPDQVGVFEPNGTYLLKVPYSDDRELLGDILRFGADVQVVSPPQLRTRVHSALLDAARNYV
jgi:predicted DNA-binding transcriptional regulator YafY